MLAYAVKRMGLAVMVTVLALVILISMIQLIPGDPAAVLLGPRATPEFREQFRVLMGLDQPVIVQIARFFGRILKGDFGTDVLTNRPVLVTVLEQTPFTLALIAMGIGWSAAIGIPLGCFAAIRRGSIADRIVGVLSVSVIAVPSFVVAIYSLLFFSVGLGWFPTIGAGPPGDPLKQLHHLVLPSLAVGLGWVGYLARLVRASMLEVLTENHIRMARAYGLKESTITYHYALKLAVIPTVVVLGIGVGNMISGAVFAEIVFARPGVGKLIYDSVVTRNYPVVMGAVVLTTAFYVLCTLLADLLAAWLDPVSDQAFDTPAPLARSSVFDGLRRVLAEPLGAFGLTLVLLVIIGAVFADVLTSYNPIKLSLPNRFLGPSFEHLLGTDQLGRDLFARVLFGARIALWVALVSISISFAGGLVLGMIAGYGPRWLDSFLILVFDAVRSFPTVMFALALVTLIGPSLGAVIIVVVIATLPAYARIVRTQTLSLKTSEFVLSARSIGAPTWRILATHIMPNLIGPLLILVSMDIPVVITIEAGMSFLGLGVRPPTPSWGSILNDGFANIRQSPWAAVAGGLPIIIATLGFTFLGETLRDTFDPRLRKEGVSVAGGPILRVESLSVDFRTAAGRLHALRDVSLDIPRGEIVGLVGESGCGKSTLINAILGLLAANGEVVGGRIAFDGRDLLRLDEDALRALRGQRISVVFQDPMTALNPVLSIGAQMANIQYRSGRSRAEKLKRAAEMLARVKIPDPERRLGQYPHQFSGGMRQRIAIAMALMQEPDLLIADEPTTALDATLEVQVIHLLKELQRDIGCAILFISHHLGVIAELCESVVVMYAGEVAERGSVRDIFHHACHPYTRKLLECDPARIREPTRRLPTVPGEIPNLIALPQGCIFRPRCPKAFERCIAERPVERPVGGRHLAACHLVDSAA